MFADEREFTLRKRSKKMSVTFEMNSKAYATDQDTLDILRDIVTAAKKTNDMSAVIAIMDLGIATGRIKELAA